MPNGFKLLFFISVLFVAVSCDKEGRRKSGIALTFDDQYVCEWYKARPLFTRYNIRATFFICQPQALTVEQTRMLKILRQEGHEIACHGMNHLSLKDFLATHSLNDYVNQEVFPAIEQMKKLGFDTKSFAYPHGINTPESDASLLKYFKILRKATYNIENRSLDQIDRSYAEAGGSTVVDAMGIDKQYSISMESVEKAMIRASARKEVLVLHAHRIMENESGYTISKEYLESVFMLSRKYGLKSMTIFELAR